MTIIPSFTTGPSYSTDPIAAAVGRTLRTAPFVGAAPERRDQIVRRARAQRGIIACAFIHVAHRPAARVA